MSLTRLAPRSRFALLLCLAAATSASACLTPEKDLRLLTGEELLEIFQRNDCRTEREQLASQLSEQLDTGELATELDEREIRFLRSRLHIEHLARALQQADQGEIATALFLLDDFAAQLRVLTLIADAEESQRADIAPLLEQIEQISTETRAILEGTAEIPAPTEFPAIPDWTLSFGFCGTSVMYFVQSATTNPGSEDAWAAVGHEELAIQHLLATQWNQGMSYGLAPPRLREFGERMLGKEGYDREVEAALASIRIDHAPSGRIAFIPLLGHWLPLPIAKGSWDGQETVVFQTADELAAWLRPMLLVDRMRN
jgi:hypothetical protein